MTSIDKNAMNDRQVEAPGLPQFRLHDISLDHPRLKIAMPLVSIHDGEMRCIGSSFLVAPGVAITAAHVVRDWVDYQEKRDGYVRSGNGFSVVAYQFYQGQVLPWVVEHAHCLWTADVAILTFRQPSWWGDGPGQILTPIARLNMNPPTVGDMVHVFGFPNSSVEDGILYISPSESVARVREIAIKSRIPIRPTSYVELDGEIAPGMSGGPCFAHDGGVIGMCSRGWDFGEDIPDSSPLSYMALLWPAMALDIDLYKTGPFPVWDLFKEGPNQARGARRVQVTSTGQARLGNVDPGSLEPLPISLNAEFLEASLIFAIENATRALSEVKLAISSYSNEPPADGPDANALLRPLRMFFWELNSATRLTLRLAGAKAGFQLPFNGAEWDAFVDTWTGLGIKPTTLDELKALGFDWNGINLFEMRTYAMLATEGGLLVQCGVSSLGEVACMLNSCRKGGKQIPVPDGLERYYESAKRFSQRLLRLVSEQASTE